MSNHPSPSVTLNQVIPERPVSIKIVGVGGAGSNGVDRLKLENLNAIPLAVINTDSQALASSPVESKCMIGKGVTRGLGTGGDPELGAAAAAANVDAIRRVVSGTDLIFLIAGMGGGTGSGAAPVVAKCAKEAGAIVISFVTLPFTFEGARRQKQAEEGLVALRQTCDAVIPLPNDILLQMLDDSASVLTAFEKADDWIARCVRSIWTILSQTGLINLDFATLRQVFCKQGGKTLFGLGSGKGQNRLDDALNDLMQCPLLHTPEFSRYADRLLVNIIGGPDLSISQVNKIMGVVNEHFGRDAHIIMGAVIDGTMADQIEICILGTTDVSGRPATSKTKTVPTVQKSSASDRSLDNAEEKEESAAFVEPVGEQKPKVVQSVEAKSSRGEQEEFAFSTITRLGYFDQTGENVYSGENLDIPTYMRRGIRIVL